MTPKTQVITHRGLDPAKPNLFAESSKEAFAGQLTRGFGLEFDIRKTADQDGELVIIHDPSLKRISGGRDERPVGEIKLKELLEMDFGGSHLTSFPDLLRMIQRQQAPGQKSAVHLKAASQEQDVLDIMLHFLRETDVSKLLFFDVKIETAQYLKKQRPELELYSSVAHPYDIERYNGVVGKTLYTIDEALAHRDLFVGVWLDEWDLSDQGGGTKTLYNAENFTRLREAVLKIALVTPELHGTSPGLLGGEAHPDAKPEEKLMARIRDILGLHPDYVCTDYPDVVRMMADET